MVSTVIIGETNESKDKVTKRRKSNVIFSSVKFASAIDAIDKSLETKNHHLYTIITPRSTIEPTTKSVLRIIKSKITNIFCTIQNFFVCSTFH